MSKTVGIFDSGLGGLTAAAEFEKVFPSKKYIYFGDTARVPYGTKSAETIRRYATQDCNFLISKSSSVIIAACGTVSANAIEALRQNFSVPVIGVVEPAADKAVEIASGGNGKVVVLGTSATVASGAYEKAIKRADKDISVVSVACPMFVPLVENGYTKGQAARLFAEEYLHGLVDFGADAVVLGCTHYPHMSEVIADILKNSVLINSGREAVDAAAKLIGAYNVAEGEPEFYVSDAPESFARFAGTFLGRNVEQNAKCIDIERF